MKLTKTQQALNVASPVVWHHMSTEQPKEDGTYVVAVVHSDTGVIFYATDYWMSAKGGFRKDGHNQLSDFTFKYSILDKIIGWMRLPEFKI